jgi:hypothetical protein
MKRLITFAALAGAVLIGVAQTSAQTASPAASPFSVQFDQKFSQTACPDGSPQGAYCINVTGTADSPDLGKVALSRIAVLDSQAKPDSNGCVPASTKGKLTIKGDDVNFSATGLYCNNVTIAAYIYIVSGGTGKYSNAIGSGIISVPPPVSMAQGIGTEPWSGTLNATGK